MPALSHRPCDPRQFRPELRQATLEHWRSKRRLCPPRHLQPTIMSQVILEARPVPLRPRSGPAPRSPAAPSAVITKTPHGHGATPGPTPPHPSPITPGSEGRAAAQGPRPPAKGAAPLPGAAPTQAAATAPAPQSHLPRLAEHFAVSSYLHPGGLQHSPTSAQPFHQGSLQPPGRPAPVPANPRGQGHSRAHATAPSPDHARIKRKSHPTATATRVERGTTLWRRTNTSHRG